MPVILVCVIFGVALFLGLLTLILYFDDATSNKPPGCVPLGFLILSGVFFAWLLASASRPWDVLSVTECEIKNVVLPAGTTQMFSYRGENYNLIQLTGYIHSPEHNKVVITEYGRYYFVMYFDEGPAIGFKVGKNVRGEVVPK